MKLHQKILVVLPLLTLILAMVSTFSVEAIPNIYITPNYLEEETFAPSGDTYVASGPNWANNPRGSGIGLFVGYGDSDAFELEQTRTLLHFDLSSLANKQATAPATLNLPCAPDAGSLGVLETFDVWALKASRDEGSFGNF
jgi:hypothetical protein